MLFFFLFKISILTMQTFARLLDSLYFDFFDFLFGFRKVLLSLHAE